MPFIFIYYKRTQYVSAVSKKKEIEREKLLYIIQNPAVKEKKKGVCINHTI